MDTKKKRPAQIHVFGVVLTLVGGRFGSSPFAPVGVGRGSQLPSPLRQIRRKAFLLSHHFVAPPPSFDQNLKSSMPLGPLPIVPNNLRTIGPRLAELQLSTPRVRRFIVAMSFARQCAQVTSLRYRHGRSNNGDLLQTVSKTQVLQHR